MTVSATSLNIGVVGAGGFANFAAQCFVLVDGIKSSRSPTSIRSAAANDG